MGFGILLIGYAFYLNTIIPVYTIPVSAIVMAFGLNKLKIWNSGFRGAWRVNFAVALWGLGAAGLAVAIVCGVAIPETLSAAVTAGLCLLVMLFHFYLGSGMVSLTQEVGLPRLKGRVFFFRTVTCIYWFLYAFLNLDLGEKLDPVVARLLIPMVVVGFVAALIGIAVLFSCYTDIGMPDEKDPPDKKGFFSRKNTKQTEEEREDE